MRDSHAATHPERTAGTPRDDRPRPREYRSASASATPGRMSGHQAPKLRTRVGTRWGAVRAALVVGFCCVGLGLGLGTAGCKRSPDPNPSSEPAPAPQQGHEERALREAVPVRAEPGASGRELYEKYCKLCHGADGTGYIADNAPSLVSHNFLESASDEFIAQGIALGRSNTAMAGYAKDRGGPLSPEEIQQIVHFLRSKGPAAKPLPKKPVTGDAARGKPLFERQCASCHVGTPAQPRTAPILDNPEFLAAATPEFLRHAVTRGRPPTPMPAFGHLPPSEIEDLLAWMLSKAPRTQVPSPLSSAVVPEDLPLVIHPKGGQAQFKLREGRYVASEQVAKALAAGRRMVIVDARSPSDWLQLRIPGSVPIPYYDHTKLKRIPNDGTWVVAYCACPHHASGEVVDALRRMGYANTAILDEGILFWRDKGYPVEGEASKHPPQHDHAGHDHSHHDHSHHGHSH